MRLPTVARDEWLVLRCQSGDQGAFADLVAEVERPLFYYVAKLTGSPDLALDILQELWIRVFQGIRKLKEPASLRGWLYKIAHGLSIDHIRRSRSQENVHEAFAKTLNESSGTHFSADEALAIHESLDLLDPLHREVLMLHFIEDFSIVEISRIVGCPEGTVKSRLHYAKKALREIISRGNHAK